MSHPDFRVNMISGFDSLTVTASHDSATTLAVFETETSLFSLGDHVYIDAGYDGSYFQLFDGYIKSVEMKVPNKLYTYTANDLLVQAQDFFIVSSNPDTPLTYQNITGEDLIADLLSLAGITDVDLDSTGFTFGINHPFEINQVSVYDQCRSITDLLAWNLWCDEYGTVKLKNRKPYYNTDTSQIGLHADTTIMWLWEDVNMIDFVFHQDEKDLRNRVVVYGANDVHAVAQDNSTPYLKWKTAVLGAYTLIDDQDVAQQTADYNLGLFDRITNSLSVTMVGNPVLLPHRCIEVLSSIIPGESHGLWYIFSAEHRISKDGYTTALELRK